MKVTMGQVMVGMVCEVGGFENVEVKLWLKNIYKLLKTQKPSEIYYWLIGNGGWSFDWYHCHGQKVTPLPRNCWGMGVEFSHWGVSSNLAEGLERATSS